MTLPCLSPPHASPMMAYWQVHQLRCFVLCGIYRLSCHESGFAFPVWFSQPQLVGIIRLTLILSWKLDALSLVLETLKSTNHL